MVDKRSGEELVIRIQNVSFIEGAYFSLRGEAGEALRIMLKKAFGLF